MTQKPASKKRQERRHGKPGPNSQRPQNAGRPTRKEQLMDIVAPENNPMSSLLNPTQPPQEPVDTIVEEAAPAAPNWGIMGLLIAVLVAIGGLAILVIVQTGNLNNRIAEEVKTLTASIQSVQTGIDPKQTETLVGEIAKITASLQENQKALLDKFAAGSSEVQAKLDQSTTSISQSTAGLAGVLEQLKNEIAQIKADQAALTTLIKSEITPQFSQTLSGIQQSQTNNQQQLTESMNALSNKIQGTENVLNALSTKLDREIAKIPTQISEEIQGFQSDMETSLENHTRQIQAEMQELKPQEAKASEVIPSVTE